MPLENNRRFVMPNGRTVSRPSAPRRDYLTTGPVAYPSSQEVRSVRAIVLDLD